MIKVIDDKQEFGDIDTALKVISDRLPIPDRDYLYQAELQSQLRIYTMTIILSLIIIVLVVLL